MIEDLVVKLSADPHSPVCNFELGLEYDAIGQYASAVSCYLRTAEFGYETHPDYVYASLIKISACMEYQKERQWSVSGSLLQAIAYMPTRPDAWFLLSRYHERQGNWQECYTFAKVGKSLSGIHENYVLPCTTEYPGKFGLDFEMGVSAWWIGRKDESLAIFNNMLMNEQLPKEYVDAILYNLRNIGA